MTSPLFIVDYDALSAASIGSEVVVSGAEGRHAVTVKRLRVGEQVMLTDGVRHVADGVVSTIVGKDSLVIRLTLVEAFDDPVPQVCVVQAIPKGERADLAVAMLTEVGVDEIVPFAASRCVVQWHGARGERARDRWVSTARESAKQARRAHIPRIGQTATSSEVATLITHADAAFVLHESADQPLPATGHPATGRIVLIVGPEGGLTSDELATFSAAGARTVRLGPTVMRTSTAGAVAAGVVLAGSARWA